LKPHLTTFRYFFMPKEHKLFVQLTPHIKQSKIGSVSIGQIIKYFELAFTTHSFIRAIPGVVTITPEQEPDKLDSIWEAPRLEHLEIYVKRPNPDDADPESIDAIYKELERNKAKDIRTSLNADNEHKLVPDKRLKSLAEASLSNGYTKANVYNEQTQRMQAVNTQDHPIIGSFEITNENRGRFVERFLEECRMVLEKLKHRSASGRQADRTDGDGDDSTSNSA
jgi:hypothetical protein